MGLLRFFLAALVLVSHLSVGIQGYNLGVIAVIVFYLLAGQVVARLWASIQHQPNAFMFFARDRLLRILPQYYAAIILAALVWWKFSPISNFLPTNPSGLDWAANLTIIPLNFFMFTELDSFMLIPPAWSLGAELQFYLLTPLIFSLVASRLWLIFFFSIGVFLLAQFGLLHTDYFGYRLLPGILFIFLLGSALAESSTLYPRNKYQKLALTGAWLAIVAYGLSLLWIQDHQPFRVEVAVGLALGLPLVVLLQRHPGKARWLKVLNRRAAETSFGIFLYHFPVIWTLQSLGQPYTGIWAIPAVLFFSVLLALAGHWCIERPLWRYLRPRVLV